MGFICGNRRQFFKLVEQLVQFFVRFRRWISILELIGQRFQNAGVLVGEASEFQIPLQDVVYIELPVPRIRSVPVKFSQKRSQSPNPLIKNRSAVGLISCRRDLSCGTYPSTALISQSGLAPPFSGNFSGKAQSDPHRI